MILIAVTGFGLGRLSVLWDSTPRAQTAVVEASSHETAGAAPIAIGVEPKANPSANDFIASKNGSAYYPADCAAGKRIKPENIVRFATSEDAERAGYRRATSCY
jgi:hypothetical protein